MEPTRELNEKEIHTLEQIKLFAADVEEAEQYLETAIRICPNETSKMYLSAIKNDLRSLRVNVKKSIHFLTI